MSPTAAALYRSLLKRSPGKSEQVLLAFARSVDWHSLTFSGERHEFHLRILGPDRAALATAICDGLEDAEFAIPNALVADIAVTERGDAGSEDAIDLKIEALTVLE